MDKFERKKISKYRALLENPCAFSEFLDEQEIESHLAPELLASPEIASGDRRRLQNPYAHVDGDGRVAALFAQIRTYGPAMQARSRSKIEVAAIVNALHIKLWNERHRIWGKNIPSNPIDMLHPEIALRDFGFEFEFVAGLEQSSDGGESMDVAGIFHSDSRQVVISTQYPTNVRRFTTAHELGHAVLHPEIRGVHRDRPLDGTSMARSSTEREADWFAAFFLMPDKLVRKVFQRQFGVPQLTLNDDTAFAFSIDGGGSARTTLRSRRDLSRFVANTKYFAGRHFQSLSEQFGVSIGAMAIRLEELELIEVR